MKNKKGFTLIEVLLVIIILVILTTSSMIGINKIEKENKEKRLNELINEITNAADIYINQNETFRTNLLNSVLEKKCIRIYTLQENNLLSYELINPVNNKMISGNLCVQSYINEEGIIINEFNLN